MAPKPPRGATGVQIGEAQARGMILQGGAMVFVDKGVRAASVEDILAAGRISRRTFYRLFGGKDDVMLALYRMGTDRLYEECRRAIEQEHEAIRYIERFVDAHLSNARAFGRLIFVLGGEAARQESPLHARRMEVHQQLVELLLQVVPDVDPLLLRGLILALEGVVRLMLEECDQGRAVTAAAVTRVRRVMLRIATASAVGDGPGVTPLPPRPSH
ncbi:MAG: TetR/AcrR family transcriptional regulator [Kofleriaceae bacterium]|nr:TetR/AcrR family transcriptional regulator [Myxococcales bacterium]MCB9562468.1 TetR/AcrR family transcriptional regulator [Kofleriaceae bacterium]MCB9570773.1 TetR/AcrR family transcriptional regulator [Kofleriaceae bacterium]